MSTQKVVVTISQTKASASSKKTGIITKLINGKMTPQVAKVHADNDPLLGKILSHATIDEVFATKTRPARNGNAQTVEVEIEVEDGDDNE
jgi:hypothetical protein